MFVFKYFSSYSFIAEISVILENDFLNLFDKLDYFNDYFSREIPAIVFRETVTSDRNNFAHLAPSAGCVRHQFMNFMIKSAIRKYKLEPKLDIT